MLVSLRSLVGLMSMSSRRAFSPTIMPSYTPCPGPTKRVPALLQVDQGVSGDLAPAVGYQGTVLTGADLAAPRFPAVQDMVQLRVPLVSVSSCERSPMRAREGTSQSVRAQPEPWATSAACGPSGPPATG